MVETQTHTRRKFLAAMGAAVATPGALGTRVVFPHSPASEITSAGQAQSQGEYLLAPGLTYLNTASLGPTPRDVLQRTMEAWGEVESNPVRMSYAEGRVHVATDRVREAAASFLGCSSEELLLTRSTTDAMNTVALGTQLTAGDRVLTTDQEHHGGADCWRYLARRRGVNIDVVRISPSDHDAAQLLDRIASAITPQTRVISVSHIVTSTGLRMPIAEIGALARTRGLLCVVDGAQAVGQITVDVKALGCHAYAASGHKWLMGPKGTGFLYVSRDAAEAIAPIQWQDGKRFVVGSTGIGNLPIIVGLGAAIDRANATGMPAIERRIGELRDYTVRQLRQIPNTRVVSAQSGPTASALVAMMLPDAMDSQAVQRALRDKYQIMVKFVEKQWFNGIRISPHTFNTEGDIDRAVQALLTELR